MPFTLAHPAAVLPLTRRPFVAAGLVAGAMAPDLPYFARALPIPVTAQSWYEPFLNATTSHSLAGSVTTALPWAVALTLAWWAARRPLGSALVQGEPMPAGQHVAGRRDVLVRGGWVLLSLLIGIATHLVWDSVTHGDGWVVAHVPALSAVAVGGLTWARLLQHASTAVGLVAVAVYLWRRRAAVRVRVGAVWAAVGVVAAGGLLGGLLQMRDTDGASTGAGVETVLRAGAEMAGVALFGAAVVFVVAWWVLRALDAPRRPHPDLEQNPNPEPSDKDPFEVVT